jgi:DnaJ-class molecular chaperone
MEPKPHIPTRCPVCNGTSIIDGVGLIKCAACDGTGKILRSVCEYCEGFGEREVATKVMCHKCLEDAPKFA